MAVKDEDLDESTEEQFYLRRLDAGLFTLQLVDCVIVECCSSGNNSVIKKRGLAIHFSHSLSSIPFSSHRIINIFQIKARMQTLLNQQGGNMKDIRSVLRGKEENNQS